MRTILAVARAELLKSWKLIAIPLLNLVGVWLAQLRGARPDDGTFLGTLLTVAPAGAVVVAAAPAALMGLGLLASDLREKRLSFFLTRPCSPLQLWVGRLAAGGVVLGASWLSALAVIALAGDRALSLGAFGWRGGLFLAMLLLGVLLVVNAIASLMASGATAWFLTDAVALSLFALGLVWNWVQALLLGGYLPLRSEARWTALAFFAALLLAGFAFLAAGRGDGRRGHRAHSAVIWSFGVIVLLGLAARRSVEQSRPLSEYRMVWATTFGGEELALTASGGLSTAAFLLDTATGVSRRARPGLSASLTDATGSRVVFNEWRFDINSPTTSFLASRIIAMDTNSGAIVFDHPSPRSGYPRALSPDGALLALQTSTAVVIARLSDLETLASIPANDARWVSFVGADRIGVIDGDATRARRRVVSSDGGVVSEQSVSLASPQWSVAVDPAFERWAVGDRASGLTVYDPDGAPLARVEGDRDRPMGDRSFQRFGFTRAGDFFLLKDSSILVLRAGERAARSMPYAGGRSLPPGASWVVGELASGEVLVSGAQARSSVALIDVRSAEIRAELPGLRSLARFRRAERAATMNPADDRDLRLLMNVEGDLFFLDPGATVPRLLAARPRR